MQDSKVNDPNGQEGHLTRSAPSQTGRRKVSEGESGEFDSRESLRKRTLVRDEGLERLASRQVRPQRQPVSLAVQASETPTLIHQFETSCGPFLLCRDGRQA